MAGGGVVGAGFALPRDAGRRPPPGELAGAPLSRPTLPGGVRAKTGRTPRIGGTGLAALLARRPRFVVRPRLMRRAMRLLPARGEPPAARRRFHPLIPPRENRTFERRRRAPARRAEPGTRRTAARLSPTPERRRRGEVRRLFSPLQFYPAAGAWLSLAEHLVRDQGVAGSNPAAPTRPVPPDGFWQNGFRPRRGQGVRRFRTHSFPPFPTQESGGHFGTHPWLKTCIFRRSCRRRFVPAGALFLALAS